MQQRNINIASNFFFFFPENLLALLITISYHRKYQLTWLVPTAE